jgi:hypothetical protein
VRGLADFRTGARKRGVRVHDFHRGVDGGTLFAVVAVLVGRAAARTRALDEAVGEEHALDRVVVLLDLLRVDETGGDEAAVDVLAELVVFNGVGAVPVVEADVEAVEVLLAACGDFGDEGLRRDAALLGGNHDRRAVHVVGADEVDLVAGHALVTHPDVSLDVLHDVAHVEGAVRVRQGGRNKKIALTHRRVKSEVEMKGASEKPKQSVILA